MKTKRWKHIRNYSIIIYDENAMEIGNKDTQYNVSKKNHINMGFYGAEYNNIERGKAEFNIVVLCSIKPYIDQVQV